jgi:tRNA (adenine37-N6)-methyltransferase
MFKLFHLKLRIQVRSFEMGNILSKIEHFSKVSLTIMMCVVIGWGIFLSPATARESTQMTQERFVLRSIGSVHKANGLTTLVLKKDVEPALKGLDGFSHVWVMWWFDRSDTPKKRSVLQVHPRGNRKNPLTGVFACRSPFRPNLIALSLCRVLSVKNHVVEIDKIDAFANTPILDLKPYIPGYDSAEASVPDWLMSREKTIDKNVGDYSKQVVTPHRQ